MVQHDSRNTLKTGSKNELCLMYNEFFYIVEMVRNVTQS
jgi:hypothetical protein